MFCVEKSYTFVRYFSVLECIVKHYFSNEGDIFKRDKLEENNL